MRPSRTAACLGIVWLCATTAAEDWPAYRHDNARSGLSAEALRPPLVRQWTFQAAHPPQTSWPDPVREKPRVRFDDAFYTALAGGMVYFGSSADGIVYALDAATGALRWRFITGGAVRLAPCVADGRVYFASDDGYAYCVTAGHGKLLWRVRAALDDRQLIGRGRMISAQPPRAGVLVDRGVAYFTCGIFPNEGVAVTAVHAATGKLIWRNDTLGNMYQRMPHGGTEGFTGISPQGYMLASKTRLYVPCGRSVPAAFDRADGRLVFWHGSVHHEGGTWALLADGALYSEAARLLPPEATAKFYTTGKPRPGDGTRLSYDAPRLMGRDLETGNDRFVVVAGERIVVTPDVSYAQNGGLVTAFDRKAYVPLGAKENVLARKLMRHFWRYYRPSLDRRVMLRKQKQLAAKGEKLSERDQNMLDKALEKLKKGDAIRAKLEAEMKAVKEQIAALVKWRCQTDCPNEMIVAGDVVYVGGAGKVQAIDAGSGKIIWTGQIQGTARGLAVADGRLVVSADNGHIYGFGRAAIQPRVVKQVAAAMPYPQDALSPFYAKMADEIVRRSGVRRGFALVYGCREGRLLYELAKRTELRIYGYEPDAAKVAAARERLAAANLLGVRANVFQADLDKLPCNDYFADLIVSETVALTGRPCGSAAELLRALRPYGGVALIGRPDAAGLGLKPMDESALTWLGGAEVVRDAGVWAKVVRGPLPGAGEWRHEYCDAGNTGSSLDELVRSPFRLLWFGRPGMAKVVDRHARAAAPLFVNGRLIHEGINYLWGIDAYNGFILWERAIKGAKRAGLSHTCSNMCATDDALFVAVGNKCLRLDLDTGETRHTYSPPTSGQRSWGWVATDNTRLFGSMGPSVYETRDLFAIDLASGKTAWTYRAGRVANTSLALANGRVFFLDGKPTAAEVEKVRSAPKRELEVVPKPGVPLPGQPYYPARAVSTDVRTLVALDAKTGKTLWRAPMDFTAMGKDFTVIASEGVLLVCANMDGARLAARSAADGSLLWEKRMAYFRRPAVIRGVAYSLPYAFDVRTGKIKMRTNPITGDPEPWVWSKAYGCGGMSASQHTMFFRSGSLAYYDVTADAGVGNFGGLKPSCWISQIAAGGLWLAPEGSAGCTCAYPIRISVALRPARSDEASWACCVRGIATTPVKHLALNLGAAGDRRDSKGRLWLAWPRPASRFGLKLNVKADIAKGLGCYSKNLATSPIAGTDKPWVYGSGICGLTRCIVPLRAEGKGEARYRVRLHFAEPTHSQPGQRTFDVKLQGRTVLKDFDVCQAAGGANRAVVKELSNVAAGQMLRLELVGKTEDAMHAPILSGLEVERAE